MKRIGAIFLALQTVVFGGAGDLSKVRFRGDASPAWENSYDFNKAGTQRIPLDPSEVPNHFFIDFPEASPTTAIKVEWRYETSLVITDEGPHLDLENWRHHVSKWAEVKRSPKGDFRFKLPGGSGELPFPTVSMDSVRAEVGKYDPSWGKLIANSKSIREDPLSVGLSKVSIRISEYRSDRWVITQILHFLIPMGC